MASVGTGAGVRAFSSSETVEVTPPASATLMLAGAAVGHFALPSEYGSTWDGSAMTDGADALEGAASGSSAWLEWIASPGTVAADIVGGGGGASDELILAGIGVAGSETTDPIRDSIDSQQETGGADVSWAPTGLQVGDLIVVMVSGFNATISAGTGTGTAFQNSGAGDFTQSGGLYYRVATSPSDTIDVQNGATVRWCGLCIKTEAAGGTTESVAGDAPGTSSDTAAASLTTSISGGSPGTSDDSVSTVAHTLGLAGDSPGTSADSVDPDVNISGTSTSLGTSSDTAAATARTAIAGGSPGVSADSASASPTVLQSLSATSPGTSAGSAAVALTVSLAGGAPGTSSDSALADVPGTAPLAGPSAGTSSDTAAAALSVSIAGASPGTSIDSVTTDAGVIEGTSPGTSSDTASSILTVSVAGSSAGTSLDTAASTQSGTAALSGGAPGTSVDTGAVSVFVSLGGASPGTSDDSLALVANLVPLAHLTGPARYEPLIGHARRE